MCDVAIMPQIVPMETVFSVFEETKAYPPQEEWTWFSYISKFTWFVIVEWMSGRVHCKSGGNILLRLQSKRKKNGHVDELHFPPL